MIQGLGIDVIEISRVEEALRRRKSLRNRLFTSREMAYCNARSRPGASFAARFAAKEAVRKACCQGGVGVTLSWQEIEVGFEKDVPVIFLHGKSAEAASLAGISGFYVSLSHSRDYACAVAVACSIFERRM